MIRRASRRSFRAGGDERWLAQFRPTFLSGCVLWLRADMGITINDAAITNGSAFDNAAWAKAGVTVTPNVATDPLGGSTADSIVETAVNAPHNVSQVATNLVIGLSCDVTVYVTPGTRSWVFVGTNNEGSFFNASTGAFGGTLGTVNNRTATLVGAGIYRVTVNVVPTVSTIMVQMSPDGVVTSYLGNGSNVFLWGASISQPKVSAWADQSGQVNNATQGTAAAQPLWRPSSVNGKPAIDCDGVDDVLSLASNITASTPTIFIVGAQLTTSAAFRALFNTQKVTWYARGPATGATDQWELFEGGDVPSTVQLTATPAVMEVAVRNFNDIDLAHNGSQVTSAAGASYSALGTSSIGAANGAAQFGNVRVREIIVYNRVLSTSERSHVRKYQGNDSGISVIA